MKNTATRTGKVLAIVFCLTMVLALTGCFWDRDGSTQKPANGTTESTATAVPDKVTPPTYQDGTAYLDAVAAKDVKLCEKVKEEKLKLRCKTEVSAMPK